MNFLESDIATGESLPFNPQDGSDNENHFWSFGLNHKVMAGVQAAGYTTPTPIQGQTIPLALSGQDIIGLAQTGSGKTVAFALPALQKMTMNKNVEVLVLTPTRELAQQVATEFRRLGKDMNLNVVAVVGGESIQRQIEMINRHGGVVVATPGRLLDHLSNNKLKRFAPHTIILDEADEMLDMGFIDSIKEIKTYLPRERQTMMFSATMGRHVRELAKSLLRNPAQVSIPANQVHEDIVQKLYVIDERDREAALMRLIDAENPSKAIVFCRTRQNVDDICERLLRQKIRAKPIHGDMSQPARSAAMKSLSQGNIQLLVATDVASRGLDISDLSHVFNYHLPCTVDRYTHRIGRTGRAGKKGVAITLANPQELREDHLFKQKKLAEFEVSSVPSKKELQAQHTTDLVDKINLQDIKPESVAACREYYKSGIGFDFMCRMFSMLQDRGAILGPDEIGYAQSEIANLQQRRREHGRQGQGQGGYGRGPRRSSSNNDNRRPRQQRAGKPRSRYS
jgi:ATP-dependent RNA helicase DeaD